MTDQQLHCQLSHPIRLCKTKSVNKRCTKPEQSGAASEIEGIQEVTEATGATRDSNATTIYPCRGQLGREGSLHYLHFAKSLHQHSNNQLSSTCLPATFKLKQPGFLDSLFAEKHDQAPGLKLVLHGRLGGCKAVEQVAVLVIKLIFRSHKDQLRLCQLQKPLY